MLCELFPDRVLEGLLTTQLKKTLRAELSTKVLHQPARCYTPIHLAVKTLTNEEFDRIMEPLTPSLRYKVLNTEDEKGRTAMAIACESKKFGIANTAGYWKVISDPLMQPKRHVPGKGKQLKASLDS